MTRGRHARAARLLDHAAAALAVRGAFEPAASAACDLGGLMLERAQPQRATLAFAQAGGWTRDAATRLRAVLGTGQALYELGRLHDAEAAFRTAVAAAPGTAGGAGVWLARVLWRRGDAVAALAAVGDADPALRARVLLTAGRIEEAAEAARDSIGRSDAPPAERCAAHVAAAHVHAAARDAEGVRRHMDEAMRAATRTRHSALRFEVAAERWACLERCGVAIPVKARGRLLRVATRLPPRAANAVRAALKQEPDGAPTPSPPLDLVRHFQDLIDATHDAGDEATALQSIAAIALRAVGACSVVIRAARCREVAAVAGRSWPGEPALAMPVLNGGAAVRRDGVTPETIVPLAAAGAVVGALAVRWVAGTHPGWERVQEVLRVTGVAAAPLVRALPAVDRARRRRGDVSRRSARPERGGGAGAAGDPARGLGAIRRPDRGRERERQGARRARHSRARCAPGAPVLRGQLRRARRRPAGSGAVRPRARRLHRRDGRAGRACSRTPIRGRCFSTKSASCRGARRRSCCASCRKARCDGSARTWLAKSTSAIVAATNRSLEHEVQAGRFRADLRFRLDVIRISLPPLRERTEDIPWLAARIWADAAGESAAARCSGTSWSRRWRATTGRATCASCRT